MKKSVRYLLPIILFAVFAFGIDCLARHDIFSMSPYILFIGLALISVFSGIISPSKKKFDLIMTVMVPLSFLIIMFIAGFLDKDDMETRFHINRALRAAFQNRAIVSYFIMAAITFLSSYKKIRIAKGK